MKAVCVDDKTKSDKQGEMRLLQYLTAASCICTTPAQTHLIKLNKILISN